MTHSIVSTPQSLELTLACLVRLFEDTHDLENAQAERET
jgi:hypothetical protein